MVDADTDFLKAISVRNFILSESPIARNDMIKYGEYPDLWHEVIQQYTRQSLSFERDIFPALQGISTRFHRHWKSAFMAGLWENGIIGDLLWCYTSASQHGYSRPQQWRAPSWSWASVVGAVTWLTRGFLFRELATYISGGTTLVCSNAFGEVRSGIITLKGRYILATIQESCFELIQPNYPGQVIGYVSYNDRYWTVSYSVQQFTPDYNFHAPHTVRPHSTFLEIGTHVKILIIAETRPGYGRGIRTHFLVLRILNEKERLYERIGYLLLHETESFTVNSLPLGETEVLDII